MSEKLGTATDRALWRSARPAVTAVDARPSPEELAAWLDRRLDEAGCARVEAALARNPELLEAALAAQSALQEMPQADPQRLIVRAQALVEPPIRRSRTLGLWWTGWRPGLQWGAVASMAIAISVGGFALGATTQAALASQRDWGRALSAVFYSLGDFGPMTLGEVGFEP